MNTFLSEDTHWMQHALRLAAQAEAEGEVPVGAVLVLAGQAIGEGYNRVISANDPTAHAEVLALRQGALAVGNYRLLEATLYVTLEPCTMCAGAMVHARIKRLVYGAADERTGAIHSQAAVLEQSFLNHRVCAEGGLLSAPCSEILRSFFKSRR
ncbi:MAG TPA: tRNA adenosine(34) deaminase TadA [Gammaproteobacteria bacterium]|jgi:tRNA(adenine34) deaminase|nr:tRNA adenosine(34) deaminase TadA [Gammaproteobacteria bacterium]